MDTFMRIKAGILIKNLRKQKETLLVYVLGDRARAAKFS